MFRQNERFRHNDGMTCLDRMNGFRQNDIMTSLDRMNGLDRMT